MCTVDGKSGSATEELLKYILLGALIHIIVADDMEWWRGWRIILTTRLLRAFGSAKKEISTEEVQAVLRFIYCTV